MPVPKQLSVSFVNTQYFREAAIAFEKSGGFENGGRYTQAPRFSKEWYEFWEEEERRVLYGHSVGGVKITGRHYWYLNYTPIKRTIGKGKAQTKVKEFPRFWAIDFDWFWYKEIARWGASKEFVEKLQLWRNPIMTEDNLSGGRHLSCLKVRRGGFSYKEASDGTYNFHHFPASKTFYFAALPGALDNDGILNKVEDMLNDINEYTDGFWLKHRLKRGTLYHQRASYIDPSDGQEKGIKSEILGKIIDDPNKARGKDAIAVKVEEGGSFKKLKLALDVLMPSLSEGGVTTGQCSLFGTGGEEGDDLEGLAEAFENPDMWNFLMFPNDWEDFEAGECGVFVPYYMCNNEAMDNDGNIDVNLAVAFEEKERAKRKKSKDPKDLDRRIAEYPETPSEALLRVSVNMFPVAEALAQYRRVKHDKNIQGLIKHGDLVRTDKGVELQLGAKHRPLDYYPHKNSDDLEGCFTIIEEPRKVDGKVPDELYFIEVDPYYMDGAEDRTSLGVARVIRRSSTRSGVTSERTQSVAWFVGRPNRLATFHENIFKLADYYNAMVQSEIGGGGQGIIDYARVKKKLHRLMFKDSTINNKEIEKEDKNRSYFLPMSTDDKKNGLVYYGDDLKEIAGVTKDGEELWNIHFEYDLGLLEEIIKFNPKKNADRISARIVGQFVQKGYEIKSSKKKRKKGRRIIDNFKEQVTTNRSNLLVIKDGEVYMN